MCPYQSRKRKYTSRGERLSRINRTLRVIAAFLAIGLVLLAFFRRRQIIAWVQTYFMD